MSIRALGLRYDVTQLVEQIDSHPGIWNQHRARTELYGTPHDGVSDIWVRFNAWENFTGNMAEFTAEHESVWYPVVGQIPAVYGICKQLMRDVGGRRLGGVLITKIPPGGQVAPHVDHGWHAQHYTKYAVQLKGNKDQAFCFNGSQLSALPGEAYTFDNSKLHWVTNGSDSDRMTLIVCIRA